MVRDTLSLSLMARTVGCVQVLGCGMIHRDIMASCGLGDHHGYAFGLGLERLAMVLYGE